MHPFAYLIIFAKSNPWGKGGRDFESCAVSEIISGDALVLVAKRTVQHRSKLLLFGWYCFHFWLRYNTSSLVSHINFTVSISRYLMKRHSSLVQVPYSENCILLVF